MKYIHFPRIGSIDMIEERRMREIIFFPELAEFNFSSSII